MEPKDPFRNKSILPGSNNKEHTELISSVMSFEEYAKIEHEVPYVYELKQGDREVLYFGVDHSNDISNPQFNEIQKKFNEIKPDVVFVEGFDSLAEKKEKAVEHISKNTIEDLTKSFGESGFVLKLAVSSGADFDSPEPKFKTEIEYLLKKGFSKEDIFAFYLYRQISQYDRSVENVNIEEYLNLLIADIKNQTDWQNFDYSILHLKKIGEKIWGEKGDLYSKEFSIERVDPTPWENRTEMQTIITKIAQESNQFRNGYMIQRIQEVLKDKKKLFIVFGASHAVMQEPALKKMFEVK